MKNYRAERTAHPVSWPTRSLPLLLRSVAIMFLCLAPSVARAQPNPASSSVPAYRQADNVAIITIRGEINDITASSVDRRIADAVSAGAGAIVFELDTPGGEIGAVLHICTSIKQSPIPNTVAWVHPKAYSGGAIIALACREIITSVPAAMGDALPIAASPLGGAQSIPDDLRKKLLPPLLSEVTDSARRAGYDEYLVQAIIIDGIRLWQVESLSEPGRRYCISADEYRLLFGTEPPEGKPLLSTGRPDSLRPAGPGADSKLPDPGQPGAAVPASPQPSPGATPETPAGSKEFRPASDRLADIARSTSTELDIATRRPVFSSDDKGKWKFVRYVTDGTGPIVMTAEELRYFGFASATIRNDQELRAFLGAKNMARLHQSWSESLVNIMNHPFIRYGLMVIFLLSMFIVMTHPGVIVPELVALISLVALLAPPMLVGMANWWEIAAIIIGICMIFLEIFVIPGFGVVGILGLLLLFGGLLGTFVPGGGGLFPTSEAAQKDLLYGVASMLLAIITSVAGMYYLSKHFGSLPVVSRLILKDPVPSDGDAGLLAAMGPADGEIPAGAEGHTVTPLRPAGRVQIGERIIDVVADMGYIAVGKRVRVVKSDEFRTVVELAPEPRNSPAAPPDRETTV
ncbi:MAG: hypothetical protein IT436_03720 [Phycisphaerales bacterium]|nr:hypothetical protein [Phycisphaerales bacterium]